MAPNPAGRAAQAGAFAAAARGYWLAVHPLIRRELAAWRARAGMIRDGKLRSIALQALSKRANMEGAAAFATFVAREHRPAVVRATVAFQTAYNHLDLLSEQPYPGDAIAHAAQLHGALPAMLADGARAETTGDGGYVAEMIDACRQATAQLPGYRQVAERAVRAAERVAVFQAYNCGARQGDQERLARWAAGEVPDSAGLAWWESAAAAGSSLGVHTMLAAAAKPHSNDDLLTEIEEAYFPWIGALHSILDQLIDTAEDARTGQANLCACYAAGERAQRIGWLTARASSAAHELDRSARQSESCLGPCHTLLLTAMAASYLSASQARRGPARPDALAVRERLGPLALPSMATFRLAGLRGARLRGLRARDARFAGGACGERGSARPSGPAPLSRP